MGWPKDRWTMLLQTRLQGKALTAYASLAVGQVSDYEVVKKEILQAYELVPEAYRIRFRQLQKHPQISHVEFAQQKAVLCDRWLQSQGVEGSYDKLRELLLLEEFKRSLNPDTTNHLEDRKVQSLDAAAKTADEYCLMHRSQNWRQGSPSDRYQRQGHSQEGSRDTKTQVIHTERKSPERNRQVAGEFSAVTAVSPTP